MNDQKLIVIGIDGASPGFIDYWIDRGELPHLKKLRDSGIYSSLESTDPPVSPVAWSSFLTGVNPGKHGVFSFIDEVKPALRIVDSESIREDFFWNELDDIRTGAINIPMTYPPEEIEGFMLSGFLSKDRIRSKPASLVGEVEEKTGENYIIDVKANSKENREEKLEEDILELLENRKKAFKYIFNEKDWDLLATVFMSSDRASHFFWEQRFEEENPLLKVFQEIDQMVGELLEKKEEETHLMIISDHGFGSLERIININNYLMDKGYLKLKGRKARVKKKLFETGITPKKIFRLLDLTKLKFLLDRLTQREKFKRSDLFLSYSDLDWEKTIAYSVGQGNIYLNKKFIENTDKNYEELRQELVDDLRKFKNPENGEKMLGEIIKTEEIYSGPEMANAPDLLVKPRNKSHSFHHLLVSTPKKIDEPITKGKTGEHRKKGIFMAYGPEFSENKSIKEPNLVDVPATIIRFFNQKIPEKIDGKPIEIICDQQNKSLKR